MSLDRVRQRAEQDAKSRGYYLNPSPEFLNDLLEGLKTNEERYGYPSCPCRMASGFFDLDRDIIYPCDYRDPDVEEHGACYCSLYVDEATHGSGEAKPVPERRPPEKQAKALGLNEDREVEPKIVRAVQAFETERKLFYCKQCGYVTFREEPPYVCPICRAKQELFAELKTSLKLWTT